MTRFGPPLSQITPLHSFHPSPSLGTPTKEANAKTNPTTRPTAVIVHKEDPVMPTTARSFPKWQQDRYIEAVRAEAFRVALAVYGPLAADDIAQEVVAKLFGRIDEMMEKYSDPVVYARAVTRNEAVDHMRRDNAQRCAGALNQRPNVYGDKPDALTGITVFEGLDRKNPDVAEVVVDVLDADYRWAEIQLGVPARELQAFVLTCLEGHTDTEAGVIMGVARETVNRWKNSGKRRLQEMLS